MSRRIVWSEDGTIQYNVTSGIRALVSQSKMVRLDAEPWTESGTSDTEISLIDGNHSQVWNFPAPVTIDSAMVLWGTTYAITWQVSSDTQLSPVPGATGNWTTVHQTPALLNGQRNEITFDTPTSTQWLRAYIGAHWYFPVYALHLFGSYDTPRMELYDTVGPTLITDRTFLDFSAANAADNYTEIKSFRIKNTDSLDHTYTITVDQQEVTDIPWVTDRFKITSTSSPTPGTTFTTPLVTANGGFSEDIIVTATINSVDNPADGWYYPEVTVEEAT